MEWISRLNNAINYIEEHIKAGTNYKKCKNSAFFWKVCPESMESIEKMVENELKFCDID